MLHLPPAAWLACHQELSFVIPTRHPPLAAFASPAREVTPSVSARGLTLTILLIVFAINLIDRQVLAGRADDRSQQA